MMMMMMMLSGECGWEEDSGESYCDGGHGDGGGVYRGYQKVERVTAASRRGE